MKELKRKFKAGQTAYLLSGHEVYVHGYVEGGEEVIVSYVIEDLCERCSDYSLFDPVSFIEESELYHDVPTKKLDKGVKVLRELIFHLKREVEDKKLYIREMKSEIKELDERVKKYDALKNVFDFIDGKMTHYVVSDYERGVNIIDSLDRYDGGRFNEKLMVLFGRSDGNLQWMLNRYSDGSGSWVDIFPCCSYEEAVRVAKDWISENIKKGVLSQSLLKSARLFSVDVPKKKIEELIEKESKFIDNVIKAAENKIRIERSKIEEIKKMANCQDVINEG